MGQSRILFRRPGTGLPGGNSLDYTLKSRGIKNIALGGFGTEGSVYATLLSAYDLGYHVYAVSDVVSSNRTELSEMLLKESCPKYSRVMEYKDFLKMFDGVKTVQK